MPIIEDIHKCIANQSAVYESQQMLQLVLDTIPVRVFWKGKDLRYLGCNRAFMRDAGFAHPDEIVGKNDYQLPWALEAESYRAIDREVMSSGQPQLGYEERLTTTKGRQMWMRTSKVPLRDAGENLRGVLGISEDITECKCAEEALKASEETLRNVFEQASVGMALITPGGRFLRVNPTFCRMFGYSQEELLERGIQDITHPGDMASSLSQVEALLSGKQRTAQFEKRHLCRDGSLMWSSVSSFLLRDATGSPMYFITHVIDITERKRAEEQLRRLYEQTRQDARTKAELLKEVNHRVKNSLIAILGLLLAEARHAPAEGQPYVKQAIDSLSGRINGLLQVHQLLSESQWAPMRLSDLAARIANAVLSATAPHLRASVSVSPSPVEISPRQAANLALIVNELVTNSIKYGAKGREAMRIAVDLSETESTIELQYRDDGPGYPQDALDFQREGVGIYLLRQLTRGSLRGSLELANRGGAVATMRIKKEETSRT